MPGGLFDLFWPAMLGLPVTWSLATLLLSAALWPAGDRGVSALQLAKAGLAVALVGQTLVAVAAALTDGAMVWTLLLSAVCFGLMTRFAWSRVLGRESGEGRVVWLMATLVLGTWAVVSLPLWVMLAESVTVQATLAAFRDWLESIPRSWQPEPTPVPR